MFRSGALALLALLGFCACEPQIVLGDRESPLPVASGGTAGTAGTPAQAGSSGAAASAASSSGAAGSAGSASNDRPTPGELVWSTDHEGGDFSDWESGGGRSGGEYDWGDTSLDVVEGAGRDDSYGMVFTIETETSGDEGVRVYRGRQDAPAFYTAWFRLEEAHTPNEWWSISLFHARDDTTTLDDDVSLWDVRVVALVTGQMRLQFYDHDTEQGFTTDARGVVEPGEWFELGLYLDWQPPASSRVMVVRDGEVLADHRELHTTTEADVYWAVGNGSDLLAPSRSALYVDDASIRLAVGSR